jgi:phosphatidylglycerophosphatase A
MHDQGALVWDEVIGMWIALFAAPTQWWWMIVGFALFRLFDIWKPWPVSWADRRVHGGLGVMLDDVVAGVYALVVLQLVALAVQNLA